MSETDVQNPVIFVPGIQGTTLRDSYAVTPETVWSVLRRDEARVAMHPENLRYELLGPARVGPDQVFSRIYGGFVDELRTELSTVSHATPVYPFPYDWRLPLSVTAAQLSHFIDEVIERTALMRPYHASGWVNAPRVDLVAHSMGGLLVAEVIAAHPSPRIGKVVTLATPFRGSPEAPIKIVTGTAELGEEETNPRDRFAARLTPALYHLIPDYAGAVVAHGVGANEAKGAGEDEADGAGGERSGAPASLWSAEGWQPSVLHSIADALERYGTKSLGSRSARLDEAQTLLQSLLDEARGFRERIEGMDLAAAGLTPDRWLRIVGVDATTRVRLPIGTRNGGPWLELKSADRVNRWSAQRGAGIAGGEGGSANTSTLAHSHETGDGTVPWLGARTAGLPDEGAVAIRPRDLGYWAVGSRVLRRGAGFHAALPAYHLVQRITTTFLKGADASPGIWGWAPPGLPPEAWTPPIPGLRLAGEDE